jgi:formylmethanofuran dehydrogenase subunit E-like metal-binding protein
MGQMETALKSALAEIGLPAGDGRLLMLTNAGYGQIDNQTTEAFLDSASAATGCTIGKRSLLPVHSSMDDGLWFSLFRRDTKALLFVRWSAEGIKKQKIHAAPEAILTPTGWKEASSGAIGKNLFSVVSISHVWAVNPPWTLFWAGSFHNHICPGVNAGYIAGTFVKEKLPLAEGESYTFDVAPAICMADALQVMFDTTAGKGGAYTDAITKNELEKYAQNGVAPMLVAMRVNRKKDICDGLVLGFDWDKAFAAALVSKEEFNATGGPMPMISRVKLAVALAGAPIEKNLSCVVELKRFSGKASLANSVVKGDPYAAIWGK